MSFAVRRAGQRRLLLPPTPSPFPDCEASLLPRLLFRAALQQLWPPHQPPLPRPVPAPETALVAPCPSSRTPNSDNPVAARSPLVLAEDLARYPPHSRPFQHATPVSGAPHVFPLGSAAPARAAHTEAAHTRTSPDRNLRRKPPRKPKSADSKGEAPRPPFVPRKSAARAALASNGVLSHDKQEKPHGAKNKKKPSRKENNSAAEPVAEASDAPTPAPSMIIHNPGIPDTFIPEHVRVIFRRLRSEGEQAYLVGGSVRDLCLRRTPKDFDVVTTAPIKQVKRMFHGKGFWSMIVGVRFPICHVRVGNEIVEVAQLGQEAKKLKTPQLGQEPKKPKTPEAPGPPTWNTTLGLEGAFPSFGPLEAAPEGQRGLGQLAAEGGGVPPRGTPGDSIDWLKCGSSKLALTGTSAALLNSLATAGTGGNSADEDDGPKHPQVPRGYRWTDIDTARWNDAIRRDFTVNSLMYDPLSKTLYDYLGAAADLKTRRIRTIKPAQECFQEDPARFLRAIRLSARLRFNLANDVHKALQQPSAVEAISTINKSRLTMELGFMLCYGGSARSVQLLAYYGLLPVMLPELDPTLNKDQMKRGPFKATGFLFSLLQALDTHTSTRAPCHAGVWVALLALHVAVHELKPSWQAVMAVGMAAGGLENAIWLLKTHKQSKAGAGQVGKGEPVAGGTGPKDDGADKPELTTQHWDAQGQGAKSQAEESQSQDQGLQSQAEESQSQAQESIEVQSQEEGEGMAGDQGTDLEFGMLLRDLGLDDVASTCADSDGTSDDSESPAEEMSRRERKGKRASLTPPQEPGQGGAASAALADEALQLAEASLDALQAMVSTRTEDGTPRQVLIAKPAAAVARVMLSSASRMPGGKIIDLSQSTSVKWEEQVQAAIIFSKTVALAMRNHDKKEQSS